MKEQMTSIQPAMQSAPQKQENKATRLGTITDLFSPKQDCNVELKILNWNTKISVFEADWDYNLNTVSVFYFYFYSMMPETETSLLDKKAEYKVV